ncbi:hypothetical protein OG799_17815 [Micromonospora sp. NBC_00898]|nr:hypothetical protein OG799_17815 [Micromonospora sp. NBC_00898]
MVLTSTDPSARSAEALTGAGVRSFVPKDQLFDADLRALLSS